MKTKQLRALQAFRRVEAWFTEHPEVIPASGTSAQALTNQVTALTQVITRMTAQSTAQATSTGQATLAAKDETTQRTTLRTQHMKAIASVANALHGQVPGIGVIKMPDRHLRSETLVAAAEALGQSASVYKDVFVEHGLPADFLDQLTSATSALKASVDARGVARSTRKGATTSLASDLDLGRRIVWMIDASLTHALANDPVTLASWRQVKRVTLTAVVPRTSSTSSSSTTAPATSGAASVTTGAAPLTLVESATASGPTPVAHAPVLASAAPEVAA